MKLFIAMAFMLMYTLNFSQSCFAQEPESLNILVLCTEGARDSINGTYNTWLKIVEEIDSINKSFSVSRVNGKVALVGLKFIIAPRLEDCTQGLIGRVVTDAYSKNNFNVLDIMQDLSADIVFLITEENDFCGVSGEYGDAFDAWAIVNYRCLGRNYSFARQLGYLLGCGNNENQDGRFNCSNNKNDTEVAYGYWYDVQEEDSNSFCTIMGYMDSRLSANDSDFNMIPYWSSDSVTYRDYPTGDSNHNNAQVINNNFSSVCRYRNVPRSNIIGNRDNTQIQPYITLGEDETVAFRAGYEISMNGIVTDGGSILARAQVIKATNCRIKGANKYRFRTTFKVH
jgi:hypothetical protein